MAVLEADSSPAQRQSTTLCFIQSPALTLIRGYRYTDEDVVLS